MSIVVFPLVFLELLAIAAINISFCNGSTFVGCIESERQALLRFKQDLKDPSNRLASWNGDVDCCSWAGVVCDKFTGHVLKLHLRNSHWEYCDSRGSTYSAGEHINLIWIDDQYDSYKRSLLIGKLNPSLLDLKYLMHLDLSGNHFDSSVPKWLFRFNHLEYLFLSCNQFQGTISSAIGNLTSLKTIDLSQNELEGKLSRSFGRLCNLRSIDLSINKLSQEMSEVLDIFSSCISDKLELLDLSHNQFFGHLSDQLRQLKDLHTLQLINNSISDPIPLSLGELWSLQYLDISLNKLNGTLSEAHFSNLMRLIGFDAFGTSLMFNVSSDWIPPFQLEMLGLHSCHLGPRFPSWLHSQKNLRYLDLSDSGLLDTIPSSFWKSHSQLEFLDLSNNSIYGHIPNLTDNSPLIALFLDSNNLSGPLPLISSNLIIFDIAYNAFSGSIFHFFCNGMNDLMQTAVFKLNDNFLSGALPNCWVKWPKLIVLNLGYNNFSGSIPSSIGSLSFLSSLRLEKNNLSGTIPVSLGNCTSLQVINLEENEFSGNIPAFIGERLSKLVILKLTSNKFQGILPVELCHLSSLQILDVANNNMSGTIPTCINNFTAMLQMDSHPRSSLFYVYNFIGRNSSLTGLVREDAIVTLKGKLRQFTTTLNLVRILDMSSNNFSGEIPIEVTHLGALQSLNLSRNLFIGKIPESIGAMRSLESFDLFENQLSGEIPPSISDLNFLSDLNLSNNNLSGKIPSSTQLQSLNASSFIGNELCGDPLPKKCSTSPITPKHEDDAGKDDDDEEEMNWMLYVSTVLGFIVGFWSVVGSLVVSRRWRFIYFGFLYRIWDMFTCLVRKCF